MSMRMIIIIEISQFQLQIVYYLLNLNFIVVLVNKD
jgi:hypothetical protein